MSPVPLHRRTLDRRTLLRGAGAGLALPWLEAMLPPRVSAPTPPVRLAWVYVPNGVHVKRWREAAEGQRLAPTLASLEPFGERLTVLRGLTQHHARANGDGPGDHARAAAVWLTGVQPLKTDGQVRLGASADQLAARHLGAASPVPALTVGCQGSRLSGQCDSGYACAYSGHISWLDERTPATKHQRPDRLFDFLFRGGVAGGGGRREAHLRDRRQGILDAVRQQAKGLSGRLGSADRGRLERYLTAVGELEGRIRGAQRRVRPEVGDQWRAPGVPQDFGEHARLLADLIHLAFQADVTRVATFLVANEGSNRAYRELGAREGHHSLSHHKGDPAKLAHVEAIDRFHVGLLAHLLGRLSEVQEGDGDLLRHSLVLYGSGIADGNRHDHHDLPLVLAGEAGGAVAQGRKWDPRRRWRKDTPLGDLHLAMLRAAGAERALSEGLLGDARGALSLG